MVAYAGRPRQTNRTCTVIGIVLLAVFGSILLCNIVLIVRSFIHPDKVADVFGFKPFVVVSGSMEDTILIDDLILVRACQPDTLTVGYGTGDIVSFRSGHTVVTHRLVGKTSVDGAPAFITKGDANNTADIDPVTYDMIEGQYLLRIPKLGGLSLFMQTPMGLLVFLILPVLAFFLYDIIHRRHIVRQYERDANHENRT